MSIQPNSLRRSRGTSIAANIQLGHDLEAQAAVTTAQLDHDLASAGLGLIIGHRAPACPVASCSGWPSPARSPRLRSCSSPTTSPRPWT